MVWRRLYICQLLIQLVWAAAQSPAGGAIDESRSDLSISSEDFVRISQPPVRLQHRFPLHVEFRCSHAAVVGVDVRVRTASQDAAAVFRHRWTCDPSSSSPDAIEHRVVRLELPRYVAYRPGSSNKHSVFSEDGVIEAWMLAPEAYAEARTYRNLFEQATIRQRLDVAVDSPFDRPHRPADVTRCAAWWPDVEQRLPYRPTCRKEVEVFQAVSFPLALSGTRTGIHRVVFEHKNAVLKALRRKQLASPRFTFSLWLYITNYCPPKHTLCNIMKHFTWDDRYATPLVYLNSKGQVQLDLVMQNGIVRSYITPTDFTLPKDEWLQLVISCQPDKCSVTRRILSSWNKIRIQLFHLSPQDTLYFDDTVGLLVFGGTEINPSFQGYIGQATLYRHKALPADQIPRPDEKHPMFELGLSLREERCKHYIQQIQRSINHSRALLRAIMHRKMCPDKSGELFLAGAERMAQCEEHDAPRSQRYQPVYRLAKSWVMNGLQFKLSDLADVLVNNATTLLEMNGLRNWEQEIVLLLKQASCFGNHDATFMLSVILNYGLVIKSNELQAHSYLMYGAMDGNRLCAMALGNKHAFGLDGIPQDDDQGYVYYKQVADKTKVDLEKHREEDVYTELVRLTNENAVKQHTEEDGDLFLWFKHQASQGITNAQQNMARMLYWGAQGITRDVEAALDYYRLAAESGNPHALYDYGIVLLKGHGTKPNMALALQQFHRAAAFNHSGAINALGWHSMEIKRNYTEAAERFERAHKLGNKDASFNLGHMHLYGRNREGIVDRVKAFDYLGVAALRGQLEAGTLIAMFNMRGHPRARRNTSLALDWARHVSEHNPAVGRFLTRGVRAFRKQNWPAALVYYAMAASTGVEVANFNLAYLCEENYEDLSSSMEKECVWRHYNLSTQRIFKNVDPFAYVKMGDYYLNGVSGQRETHKAAELYCNAAIKGYAQGLYNLANMVEEGFYIRNRTWYRLQVPQVIISSDNATLAAYLYSRCMDSDDSESFLPCTLSLYRVQATQLWNSYWILILVFFFFSTSSVLAMEFITFYKIYLRQHVARYNV